MRAYPCQRTLTPSALLELADECYYAEDYGAAMFYAVFVSGIPELDEESSFMRCAAEDLLKDVRAIIHDDLVKRLENTGVVLSDRNYNLLLDEHSPYGGTYFDLLNKFGAKYP